MIKKLDTSWFLNTQYNNNNKIINYGKNETTRRNGKQASSSNITQNI
jgi:hypothetical protein